MNDRSDSRQRGTGPGGTGPGGTGSGGTGSGGTGAAGNGSGGTGEHVDLIARELALGLLAEEETEAAWTHVQECPECADTLRVVRSLYETALEDGTAHISAEKLVQQTGSGLTLSRTEQLHLEHCGDCRADMELLRATPDIGALTFGPRSRWPRRRWSLGGGVVLAAAALAFVALLPERRIDTAGLAEIVPVDVRVPRGGVGPGNFEEAWLAALGEYSNARYAAAEAGFREAVALDPRHAESWLLLGSSLLIQGREEEAIPALDTAAELAPNETVREEAEWQRILALLAQGSLSEREFDEVTSRVHSIALASGPRASSAQELVERLRAR